MITTSYNYRKHVQNVYVDGELDNSKLKADSIPTPNIYNTADVIIGKDNPLASPNGYYLNGKMDALRIYNRLLPDNQIEELYSSVK